MKNKKSSIALLGSFLLLFVFLSANISFAQTKSDSKMMKDCCMMKDGKMMQMKDGKMIPMEKDMTMKNGTKCMTNGECMMKDGKKMMMKEGECMDMNGMLDNCSMMNKGDKSKINRKVKQNEMGAMYACPMHPEVTGQKGSKCSKCGMDLVEKK